MKKLLLLVLLFCVPSHAYLVGPGPSLKELDEKSDVIFKGVAIDSAPADNAGLGSFSNFPGMSTRFRVISVLKGTAPAEVKFRHYGNNSKFMSFPYAPKFHVFKAGQPYLIWAKRGGDDSLLHFSGEASFGSGGVLRAGDELPVQGTGKSVAWRELGVLLKGDGEAQSYAMGKLREFGGDRYFGRTKPDFSADEIWPLVLPFLQSQAVVTTNQPIFVGQHTTQAALAARAIETLSALDRKRAQPLALLLARESKVPQARAAAFGTLNGSQNPAVREAALDALKTETDDLVRSRAVTNLGYFTDETSLHQIENSAKAAGEGERLGAINAMSVSKNARFLPVLEDLTTHNNPTTQKNAAEILLQFPAPIARPFWEKQAQNPLWKNDFYAALGQENPVSYRAQLRQIVQEKPNNAIGGYSITASAWKSLARTLTLAPEVPTSDFDLLERGIFSSSFDWHDLYRAYLLRGEMARAQKLKTEKSAGNLEFMKAQFEQIDREMQMNPNQEVPKLLASGFQFTEGPVWNPKTGEWLFSDIPADTIFRANPSGETAPFLQPSFNANGNAFDANGDLVSCQHGARRVAKWDGEKWIKLAEKFEGKRLNSPNDLAIHSNGTIYFTDPTYGVKKDARELDFTGLYRLLPDGTVELLDKEWQQPNGICFSPDQKRLYVNDSQAGKLFAFDVESDGRLKNKTLLATIPKPGDPDGMKCDEWGRILVGGPGGVWVFGPSGVLLQKIALPKDGANLAFGGRDGKTLLVTARGAIYTLELNVKEGRK